MKTKKTVSDKLIIREEILTPGKLTNKNLQKRSSKYIIFIFVLVLVVVLLTRLVSATLGAGGPLDGGGPLHGAGQSWRRGDVLHVVRETELVEALRRIAAL